MSGRVSGQTVLIDRLPYGSTPDTQPVDSARLKEHIQLTHSLDDNIVLGVGGYLPSATEDTENRGNVSLIRQKRRQIIGEELLGCLSGECVLLGYGPVIGTQPIVVTYLDSDGVEQTLPATNYRLLADNESLYFFGSLPSFASGPGTVWVDYEAGYGDTSDDVPARWQNIVMTIAMRKYDFRGGDSGPSNDSWERMINRMVVNAGGSRRG